MGVFAVPETGKSRVVELNHPLAAHHLSILRDTKTTSSQFRNQVQLLSMLLAVKATEDLELERYRLQTPLCSMDGQRISQRIALVPILRAGLGLVDPVLRLLPDAEVWHLGMYRDEETAQPVEYYSKRFADVANSQSLAEYTVINLNARWNVSDRLAVSLAGVNLTNVIGLTEGNPRAGQFVSGDAGARYYLARPILGTSWRAALTYRF